MSSKAKSTWRRAVIVRLLAVLLGLSPLLALELVLRVAGYQGMDAAAADPFVQFAKVRPLFEPSGDGTLAIPASRQEYFRPEQFLAEKPPRQFRIFCLGGSTVQGRPYAIETSFSTWLELSLQAADPQTDWEVINCGGVSYASYRLLPILQEVLEYEPDLIILYSGHNEFLEDRTYAALRSLPGWAAALERRLDHSRSFRLARNLWRQARTPAATTELTAEVDALLDYRGGLEQYHRDDRWRRSVMEHYAINMRRMVQLVQQRGLPVIVCDPVSNLSDSPPFKSESALEENEQQRFSELLRQAAPDSELSLLERMERLQQAVQLDPRHAGAQYQLAKALQAAGRPTDAKQHLLRAKEEDICPLRMLEPMHQALQQIAQQQQAIRVDVRGRFEALSADGIVGAKWLVDHVHPSVHGHQKIAAWLMEALQHEGLVAPQPDYDQRRRAAYQRHLASLDELYYARGKRRLEGLRRWSQGRAFKTK